MNSKSKPASCARLAARLMLTLLPPFLDVLLRDINKFRKSGVTDPGYDL